MINGSFLRLPIIEVVRELACILSSPDKAKKFDVVNRNIDVFTFSFKLSVL